MPENPGMQICQIESFANSVCAEETIAASASKPTKYYALICIDVANNIQNQNIPILAIGEDISRFPDFRGNLRRTQILLVLVKCR